MTSPATPDLCAICGDATPTTDRIDVGEDKVAHFRCLAQLAVTARRSGKLVVIAERRGKWAKR